MKTEQEKCGDIRIHFLDDGDVILTQGSNAILLELIDRIDLAHTIHPKLRIKAASALELLENGDYDLAVRCLKEALEL